MRIENINDSKLGVDVSKYKNIAITGLNGVGKSHFLRNILNKESGAISFSIENENKREYDILLSFHKNHGGDKYKIHKNERIFFTRSENNFLIDCGSLGHGTLVQTSWEYDNNILKNNIENRIRILDLNALISSHNNSNFRELESRVINLFNEMSSLTTSKIIDTNGNYSNEDINEYGYVRLKKSIEGFLNGKKIYGVKNGRFMIEDLDKKIKEFDVTLSDGEKILFGIAAEILENKSEHHAVYVWDEPETNLNPSWQRKIINFINTINPKGQLILATHSTHILGAMSINANSVILELKRTEGGSFVNETTIFDNRELLKEHNIKNGRLSLEDIEGKSILLVEGESDKILLESVIDTSKFHIHVCGGDSLIPKYLDIFQSMLPSSKIICIFDTDNLKNVFSNLKVNDLDTFKMKLPNMEDGFAIEKYFENEVLESKSFEIIREENINKRKKEIVSKGGSELEIEIIKKIVKKTTFLFSDRVSLNINKKLPSKVEFANFLVKEYKEMVGKKLSDLKNEIIKKIG